MALPQFQWRPNTEVVLLAGDIMDGVKPHYIDWVLQTCEGRRGLITLGNHELYGSRREKAVRELIAGFSGSHVQLLLNQSVVIGGVRIAGTDLWTDFSLQGDVLFAGRDAETSMSDYRRIRVKDGNRFRRLRAADTQQWNREARAFIRRTLDSSNEPVVLMTHHAPSLASIPEDYRNGALAAAYATDMEGDYTAAAQVPIVNVHGHVHRALSYQMRCGTYVVANPYGYHEREDDTGFDPSRSFSVDSTGFLRVEDAINALC